MPRTSHKIFLGDGFHLIIEDQYVFLYQNDVQINNLTLDNSDSESNAMEQMRDMLSKHLSEEAMKIYDRWMYTAKNTKAPYKVPHKKELSVFQQIVIRLLTSILWNQHFRQNWENREAQLKLIEDARALLSS